jgi:hypothetical protein
MVSVQAACTMAEAMTKLEVHAAESGLNIEDLALAVVERRTRFS